jgi:hypothetical protein
MVAPEKMEGLFFNSGGRRAVLISEELCSPEETEGLRLGLPRVRVFMART